MKDHAMIEKLKEDDEEVLGQLIDHYYKYVSAILCNLCRTKLTVEDLEELCADVFISVWKKRKNLKDCESLKPYLAQIARNTAISRLRKSNRIIIPFDDTLQNISKESFDRLTDIKEQSEIINEAVADFKEPEREIFIRFYFFGEKIKKISNRLALHPATVKTKLYRCRKHLKKIFEERGYVR
ncbi:MAG: sigma-70 family polymerase sigma factor [Clostridia bacterium]|jgi:RNA polymerase sigma-70 factor (ECF subfamily)|nr:sigma-70 family polymerase sigma factor [Clostridia bacterium]